MNPVDLLHLAPDSLCPGKRRNIARAFQQAWLTIAPSIGDDRAKIKTARLWLAEVIVKLAEEHDAVDILASAVIFAAVREALHDK